MTKKYKLRNSIEITQEFQDQQFVFLISCNYKFCEPLVLKQICAPILNYLFDGISESDIQKICSEVGFQASLIMELIQLLDSSGYLEGSNFLNIRNKAIEDFKLSAERQPSHAGSVYPSDSEALKLFVQKILDKAPASGIKHDPVCLIAPHIDYARGSLGYAYTYRYLINYKPDICILFGTSHKGGQNLFQLSTKNFVTPLTTLKNDLEFTTSLIQGYGENRSLADEYLHKYEHSLDLQMPFLSYLCPECKIVPILVNSFHRFLGQDSILEQSEEYALFVQTCKASIKKYAALGKKILIVAAVDMAHIGIDFGDSFKIDREIQSACEVRDREYLDSICSLSATNMLAHISSDLDQRRICGFPSLHSILDVLSLDSRLTAKIDHYEQTVNRSSSLMVSFASAAIFENFS